MKSRMEKYYTEKPNYTRLTRNAGLYKEVYRNYAELENLPIADNTNEIDIKDLKRMMNKKEESAKQTETYEEELITSRKQVEQREYDINKILEKAKSTNKNKEENKKNFSPNYKYLTTLESQEIIIPEIRREYKQQEKTIDKIDKLEELKEEKKEEEKYMTRELKFHEKQLEVTREIKIMEQEESSPLDLFENLKPDDNSFIVEPVKVEKDSIFSNSNTDDIDDTEEEIEQIKAKIEKINNDIEDEFDNSDIDIIKKESWKKEINKVEDDFYTSSYKFSKNDFVDEEDDFYDKPKKGSGILKVIMLLLAILGLTAIIYFFINKYGIGI